MHEIRTQDYYIKINKCYVHVVQYGNSERVFKLSANSSKADHNGKRLVIFLPGNPGPLGIYHDYLSLLYKTMCESDSDHDCPILLAISHNNFGHPNETDQIITVEEDHMNFIEQSIGKSYETHDVELQVLNKLIILKQLLIYNLEDCQLVFIGHSIGCYIILKLLQDGLLASVHHGSVMIHPALENLALTEKGSLFARYFDLKLDYVLKSLAFILETFLSKSTRVSLIKRFACSNELAKTASRIVLESLAELLTARGLNSTIEMAKSEFVRVKNIDHQLLIKPHVDRIKLIYAIGDHWVNSDNRKELLAVYPKLHIEELPRMHAFIMEPKTVVEYATKVSKFIGEYFVVA